MPRAVGNRSGFYAVERWRAVLPGVGLCLSMCWAPALPANQENVDERVGTGNIGYGKELSDAERCQECHGKQGNGNDFYTPKHAGQYADYLVKQLKDFQTGARRHDVMNRMAEDLEENDMADIAAYFASRRIMQGKADAVDSNNGKVLFLSGDEARGLTACSDCHGIDGQGRLRDGIVVPVIGGQRKAYLYRQLVNWRSGERSNSPGGIMNDIGRLLTDQDIDALSDYVSGLPDR